MSSDSGEEVSVDMRRGVSDNWNNSMITKLTEAVQQQLSSSVYNQAYNEVNIDWESVGESVGQEAEKCHAKWTSMLQCIRTFRTMPEILLDMQTQYAKKDIRKANINNRANVKAWAMAPVSSKPKVKKDTNPDHPKKPGASGYSLFCREVMPQLKGIVGMNKFLKVSEMWKEVSDNEKAQYNEKSAREKHIYLEEVKEYAEDHPDDQKIQDILAEITRVPKKRAKSPQKKKDTTLKQENGEASATYSEDEQDSSLLSPRKKLKFSSKMFSPKKATKKTRTGESVYVEMKLENYQAEHPERDVDYLVEKLKRKFAKLSDSKKEKYEDMAMEDK